MLPVPPLPAFDSPDARTADALLRSFGGRLFAYFRFMLGSESGAKRALSATLAAALPEAARARDLEQYGPRLFTLAHAECRKYQCAEAVGAGQHWAVVTGSGNPVLPEIARRAVARLAPDVREAYLLSAPYNNLTLPQMAEVLGLGLDAAADRRAQAGLDFVRAVAQCATEAGFIQFAGAELRIRAEESLERDASEPPPTGSGPVSPAPSLAELAPAPAQQPPRTPLPPPSSLPDALPSSVALPPPSELPPPPLRQPPSPVSPSPAATTVEPAFLAPGNPTRLDQPASAAFHGGPDYDGGPGYDGDRGYGSDRFDAVYRASEARTGPLRALTGPLMLDDDTPRGRRRRQVLAWTGGGIAVAAVAVIGWQLLGASGPGSTITLTHGGIPTAPVESGSSPGGPASGSPSPSQSPTAGQSPTATPAASGTAGIPGAGTGSGAQTAGGTAPAPAGPQPGAGSRPASVPATQPASAPASSQPAPAPTTASPAPTDSTPQAPPPTTASPGSSS